MRTKKLRGKKRRLRIIKLRLLQATSVFPTHFVYGVHSLKLPTSQVFVEFLSEKGKHEIKQELLASAMTLRQLKPHQQAKIAVLHFPDNMFRSEIVVFNSEQSAELFFDSRKVNWTERQELEITNSGWLQKVFLERIQDGQEQQIVCYIER